MKEEALFIFLFLFFNFVKSVNNTISTQIVIPLNFTCGLAAGLGKACVDTVQEVLANPAHAYSLPTAQDKPLLNESDVIIDVTSQSSEGLTHKTNEVMHLTLQERVACVTKFILITMSDIPQIIANALPNLLY